MQVGGWHIYSYCWFLSGTNGSRLFSVQMAAGLWRRAHVCSASELWRLQQAKASVQGKRIQVWSSAAGGCCILVKQRIVTRSCAVVIVSVKVASVSVMLHDKIQQVLEQSSASNRSPMLIINLCFFLNNCKFRLLLLKHRGAIFSQSKFEEACDLGLCSWFLEVLEHHPAIERSKLQIFNQGTNWGLEES